MNFEGPSDFLSLKEGENPIRIVGKPIERETKFGKRWSMWVIDRVDGAVRALTFGKMIGNQIKSLQASSEYRFDELPEYDMTIVREGTGPTDTRYTVRPARNNTELTAEEQELVRERGDIMDFFKQIDAKRVAKEYGGEVESNDEKKEVKVDDLPF